MSTRRGLVLLVVPAVGLGAAGAPGADRCGFGDLVGQLAHLLDLELADGLVHPVEPEPHGVVGVDVLVDDEQQSVAAVAVVWSNGEHALDPADPLLVALGVEPPEVVLGRGVIAPQLDAHRRVRVVALDDPCMTEHHAGLELVELGCISHNPSRVCQLLDFITIILLTKEVNHFLD